MGEETRKKLEGGSPPQGSGGNKTLEEEVHKNDIHYKNKKRRLGGVYYGGEGGSRRRSLYAAGIVLLLVLAGVAALTVWLIYRPHHKPRFAVVGASIFDLAIINDTTTSTPPHEVVVAVPLLLLSASMQFSIIITNPNKRVSIFYDHLSAFVTYHNQIITQPPLTLPPLYQHKHSSVHLSPSFTSNSRGIPVSPEVSYGLALDEAVGVVGLRLVVLGKLKWKAGAITTSHYPFHVNCDLLLRLLSNNMPQQQGKGKGFLPQQLPFLTTPVCHLHV